MNNPINTAQKKEIENKRKIYNKVMKTNLNIKQFIEQAKLEGLKL